MERGVVLVGFLSDPVRKPLHLVFKVIEGDSNHGRRLACVFNLLAQAITLLAQPHVLGLDDAQLPVGFS